MAQGQQSEIARFFRAEGLAALQCLQARYYRHVFAPHFHDEYVINTLYSGAQAYRWHGSKQLAGPGSLILINPGEVHTGESAHESGWSYCGFYPDQQFIHTLARQIGRATDLHFRTSVVHEPASARQLIELQELLRTSADQLARDSATLSVFGHILRQHMQVKAEATPRARPAIEWVRQRLADNPAENISLEELAAEAGLSPWQLSRGFRQQFGLPPVAWRNQQRINRARQLLAQGHLPVNVASMVGFADQAHLTRQFHATLGITPAAYRRHIFIPPHRGHA